MKKLIPITFTFLFSLLTFSQSNSESIHFQNRIRYRALFTYPITKEWYLNLHDEIFLKLEDEKYRFNRIGIGGGYYFNKDSKV